MPESTPDKPKFVLEFDYNVIADEVRKGVLRQLQGAPNSTLLTPLGERAAAETKRLLSDGKFDDVIRAELEALRTNGVTVIRTAIANAFRHAVQRRVGQVVAQMVAKGELASAIDAEIRSYAATKG